MERQIDGTVQTDFFLFAYFFQKTLPKIQYICTSYSPAGEAITIYNTRELMNTVIACLNLL